jgi:flagellar biosynthesis GTPase FlhF
LEGALKLIKHQLGPDALILSTENRRGSVFRKASVEVTAAFVEPPKESEAREFDEEQLAQVFPHRRREKEQQAGKPPVEEENPPPARASARPAVGTGRASAPAPARRSASEVKRHAEVSLPARQLESDFLAAGLSPETAAEFAGRLVLDYPRSDRQDPSFLSRIKAKCLAGSLRTLGPEVFESRRCWAAVGTPGCGKTSLLVKLGIFLRARKQNTALVSCDRRKIIGRQELAAYAKLIRTPFSTEIKDRVGAKVQLIDTPALTWESPSGIEEAQRICRDSNTLLVLDASQRLSELLRIVDMAATLAPVALAFTRLDMVSQSGVIYEVLRAVKLPLLGASVSQSFSIPFRFFEPADLARHILGERKPTPHSPK